MLCSRHSSIIPRLVLIVLFMISITSSLVDARYSPEEKQAITEAAHEADKSIRFIKLEDIDSTLKRAKTAVIMFGAAWCINTKRMTPKFLEVQNRVDAAGFEKRGFQIGKVECTTDGEKTCAEKYKIEGYPTLLVYVNGALKEEYPGADEAGPLFDYITNLIRSYHGQEIDQQEGKESKLINTGMQRAVKGDSSSHREKPVTGFVPSQPVMDGPDENSKLESGWSLTFIIFLVGCVGTVLVVLNPSMRRMLLSRRRGGNGYRRLHTPP